jgi:hypothetical protein
MHVNLANETESINIGSQLACLQYRPVHFLSLLILPSLNSFYRPEVETPNEVSLVKPSGLAYSNYSD